MKITFSNRVEQLFDLFKQELFSTTPFAQRLIIVPSPAVKNWLTLKLAQDPDLQVSMGIKISYLEQTLSEFRQANFSIPSVFSLSFAIEKELRLAMREDSDQWQRVKQYLGIEGQEISRKSERRLIGLSETLSSLFQQYGVYGGQMVAEWEQLKTGDWQGVLWRHLFSEGRYPWSYPAKEYQQSKWVYPTRPTHLYLFSISSLSQIHHRFLCELSKSVPIQYYLLSPCQTFWSDILTDREAGRLQMHWRKQGVSEAQQGDLELYLSDRNPLLANYGKLGREMARILEETQAETVEYYCYPQAIAADPAYENNLHDEMGFEATARPLSVLDAVQCDMGLMRSPEGIAPAIDENDRSIQVHMAPNRIREIEIVRDLVMQWIGKDKILPEEIIVMAPKINEYAPFVKSVFSESPVDFRIMDLGTPMHNEAIQAFLHLLALPYGRWDAPSILQLLEFNCFSTKQKLSREQVAQITTWIRETGVCWGENASHRELLLQRDHHGVSLVDKNGSGTWEHALGMLLSALVMPMGNLRVDSSQSELLGRFIDLLNNLKHDLRKIQDGAKLTLEEWVAYLRQLAEKNLVLDEESNEYLQDACEQLLRTGDLLGNTSYRFPSIQKRLNLVFAKQEGGFRDTHLHAVRFCSMMPMRAIPAKAIILMGMQEGKFPKKTTSVSLNQCLHNPDKVDFCPSDTDYDRFLFLEALLSARQFLYFTYQNISQEDGKQQPPNILLTELLAYINKSYGKNITPVAHQLFGFDKNNFSSDSPLRSSSQHAFIEAQSYYKNEKSAAHLFVTEVSSNSEENIISVKELSDCAKAPLKIYLNKNIDFFIREEDEDPTGVENFQIGNLEKYQIRKNLLRQAPQQVFAENKNKIPPGLFGEIEVGKILDESEMQKKFMQEIGVKGEEFFTITLSEECQQPHQDENGNWEVPALELENQRIIGKIEEVTPKGLWLHAKKDRKDAIKAWPTYLVLNEIIKRYQLPIKSDLLFGRAAKSLTFNCETNHLKQFVDYYKMCLKAPCPLIPEWIVALLGKDAEKFQQAIMTTLEQRDTELYDKYIEWTFRGSAKPIAAQIIEKWKSHAEKTYSEMLGSWFKN